MIIRSSNTWDKLKVLLHLSFSLWIKTLRASFYKGLLWRLEITWEIKLRLDGTTPWGKRHLWVEKSVKWYLFLDSLNICLLINLSHANYCSSSWEYGSEQDIQVSLSMELSWTIHLAYGTSHMPLMESNSVQRVNLRMGWSLQSGMHLCKMEIQPVLKSVPSILFIYGYVKDN